MKLIIAEKPDQGSTLASIFKHKKQKGFIEIFPNEVFINGAYVTWAIGHLCQLVSPEKYQPGWKKWSFATLPMIPLHFEYEVTKDKAKQFAVIKTLAADSRVTEIIHAGDAGREGELIIRNILRLTRCKKPMKRLWISSLTPNAIREGFNKLLDEDKTRSLYFEAYTRACADWIVGMNASRLYSLLLQKQGFSDVFSVGRVQTPTLALIVKRELEIENFKAEPFWEIIAKFLINEKRYTGKWKINGETRAKTKELAEKVALFCKGKPAEVADVLSERKEFFPPLLYNLSALQAEANKRYKFSPKKTLDIMQVLYQKGNVSYPRSDSRYVTKEEANTFPEILSKLSKINDFENFFPLPITSISDNKRYVNEKKVTDHYAIIPTEQIPNVDRLSTDERKIYELIVTSLIAAHYPKAIAEYTTVTTLVDGRASFISKGKVQIEEGWRKVIHQKDTDDEPVLPSLTKGEQGLTEEVEVKESQTQPPKRYTEGQLITLMKTAGKHIEDKELEKILTKTEGLGTEATRAGIITMLKDRMYIEVNKNVVYATVKAKILIESIGQEILASPEMTAKWEQKLKEISEGLASPKQFMEQTTRMISHLISSGIGHSANWTFSDEVRQNFLPAKQKTRTNTFTKIGPCKKCDGSVVDKGNFYGCSNYQNNHCDFTISKKIFGKNITQKNIKLLLLEGRTELIEGFTKDDKTFNARLFLDEKEKRVKFLYEETTPK
jgi:DNA topoisomerase-3